MYAHKNFRTKKQLKDAVQAWNAYAARDPLQADADTVEGPACFIGSEPKPRPVTYYQPGPFGGNEPKNGTVYIEGPHYPASHAWYAQCEARNGVIVKVK